LLQQQPIPDDCRYRDVLPILESRGLLEGLFARPPPPLLIYSSADSMDLDEDSTCAAHCNMVTPSPAGKKHASAACSADLMCAEENPPPPTVPELPRVKRARTEALGLQMCEPQQQQPPPHAAFPLSPSASCGANPTNTYLTPRGKWLPVPKHLREQAALLGKEKPIRKEHDLTEAESLVLAPAFEELLMHREVWLGTANGVHGESMGLFFAGRFAGLPGFSEEQIERHVSEYMWQLCKLQNPAFEPAEAAEQPWWWQRQQQGDGKDTQQQRLRCIRMEEEYNEDMEYNALHSHLFKYPRAFLGSQEDEEELVGAAKVSMLIRLVDLMFLAYTGMYFFMYGDIPTGIHWYVLFYVL
jgi:hypothetical protein